MREFVALNDPILRQKSYEVPVDLIITPYVQKVIEEMQEVVLHQHRSYQKKESTRDIAGLAAPQIGYPLRIILVDIASNSGRGHLFPFINPEIIWNSQVEEEYTENCFSVPPEVYGVVSRPREITIRAYEEGGGLIYRTFDAWVARVFQHERDHLDGLRFPDNISDDSLLHQVGYYDRPEYNAGNWEKWPYKYPRDTWEETAGIRPIMYPQGWHL